MDSAIAHQTLPTVLPPDVPQNNKNDYDDNEYISELFAQLINPALLAPDSNDNSDHGKGRSNSEPGPQKRGTKRPAEQQDVDVAQDSILGNNQSGGGSQNHSFFDIGDEDPLLEDFNALSPDDLSPVDLPEAASSAYTGVDVHGNVNNNNIFGSAQMINPPIENTNIHISGGPLPINGVSSYLGSATGGLANDLFVGAPLNNTSQSWATQQIPEAIPMMPVLYNPHAFSVMQGSYPANLLPQGPQNLQPVPSRGPNAKRQRQSPSQAAPAPASAPVPTNTIRIVHDELSMPSDFRANPNNHARFRYNQDGTREYLNAPKKPQKGH